MIIYECTAPDGTPVRKITHDYIEHTVAVLGLMRLRKPLPKLDPEDKDEEPRYEKTRLWILIGTAESQARAEQLAACQALNGITEEVVYLPIAAKPYIPPPKPKKGEEDAVSD